MEDTLPRRSNLEMGRVTSSRGFRISVIDNISSEILCGMLIMELHKLSSA